MDNLPLLLTAAFGAGILNTIAGGGTFLTFPALVFAGIPPVAANATATLSALPGYLASAWAFRHDIRPEGALGIRAMAALTVAGGLAGALLLMLTPDEVFAGVVPWLLLAATLLFALGPRLVPLLAGGGLGPAGSALALFAVSVYGGYFNGGLGIMLLAAFSLMGFSNLHGMNGLKTAASAILAIVVSVAYAAAGLIAWDSALVLALATTVGGYLGGHWSRRIRNTAALRAGIVGIGAAMTLAFFLR